MLLIIGWIKLIKERHQNNITSKAGGPWGKKDTIWLFHGKFLQIKILWTNEIFKIKFVLQGPRIIFCLNSLPSGARQEIWSREIKPPQHLLIVSALYCPTQIILPYKSESHLTWSSECNYFHKLMPYYKGLENWVSVSSRIKKPSLLQTKVATMHACMQSWFSTSHIDASGHGTRKGIVKRS